LSRFVQHRLPDPGRQQLAALSPHQASRLREITNDVERREVRLVDHLVPERRSCSWSRRAVEGPPAWPAKGSAMGQGLEPGADCPGGHEAIYQALFVQGRGALRRELTACLIQPWMVAAHGSNSLARSSTLRPARAKAMICS